MALKTFKPYTPARRFLTMLDKSEITKQTPEKSLTESKKRTGGRNSHGEVTSWHRGGGHAQHYRVDRFPARQDRNPGEGGGHRIRSEPFGAHRAAALCRRREALHSAAGGPGSGHDGAERRRRGHSSGKRADRSGTFLPARWCTTWSFIPARAARWCARRAARRSCSARKAISRW